MGRNRSKDGRFGIEERIWSKGKWKGKYRWVVICRKGWEFWSRIIYQNDVLNGREILEGYEIHHRNENQEDDDIDNLEMLSKADHRRLHSLGRKHSLESREKMSASQKGKKKGPISLETKAKMSENNARHWEGKMRVSSSLETREKMSESQKESWNKRRNLSEKYCEDVLEESDNKNSWKRPDLVEWNRKNKSKQVLGENNVKAKLKEIDVIEIKKLLSDGVLPKNIAIIYKVSSCTIYNIRLGRIWKHIK
mgnify:CR=1 FL=1